MFTYSIPYRVALYLVIAAHIAGFIGLQVIFLRPLFELLIPFNLVFTALLLFSQHRDWGIPFFVFTVLATLGGFFLEVLGVHSKIIFGDYWYEYALGAGLFGVPFTIGLNWWVLVYVCGIMAQKTGLPTLPKVLIGASLMTFLDVWIEQVAMQYHFWDWAGKIVPLQNYVAWFIASACLLYAFFRLSFHKENKLAVWVYGAQLAFFVAHNLMMLL